MFNTYLVGENETFFTVSIYWDESSLICFRGVAQPPSSWCPKHHRSRRLPFPTPCADPSQPRDAWEVMGLRLRLLRVDNVKEGGAPPSDVCWFINQSKCRYIYHKPELLELQAKLANYGAPPCIRDWSIMFCLLFWGMKIHLPAILMFTRAI